jgi:DNA-binding transcriptional LysR family regulator
VNLKHIKAFVEVADTKHFGRAALNLKMTQSGLSQMIKVLEKSLGTQLIVRTTRSVELTDIGHSFYENCLELIQAHRLADERMANVLQGEQGTVRLGFVASAALGIIPKLSVAITKQAPSITLVLDEITTARQISLIKDGHLDVGLLREVDQSPGLQIFPLVKEALVLAVPGDHKLAGQKEVSIRDLKDEAFVAYPRGQVSYLHNHVLKLCDEAGFVPRVAQEAVQFATILGLVSSNVGIAIVPQSVASIQLKNVSFLDISGPEAFSNIFIARRRDDMASPAQKRFTEIALSTFKITD